MIIKTSKVFNVKRWFFSEKFRNKIKTVLRHRAIKREDGVNSMLIPYNSSFFCFINCSNALSS